MPKRPISRVARAALLMTFAAGPAAAQSGLNITVSPNPNKIEAGVSAFTFSVTVNPVQCAGTCTFRVEGQATTSAFTTEWLPEGASHGTLTFSKSYTVPASAGVGDNLCFALRLNQTLQNRYTNSKVVATECRTVSTPMVSIGTQPAPTAAAAPPTGTPSTSAADQPARTAVGRAPLPPPDLTVAFEKTPMARWIVRNIGQGPAPATVLRLYRDGLPDKDIAIVALAAGGDLRGGGHTRAGRLPGQRLGEGGPGRSGPGEQRGEQRLAIGAVTLKRENNPAFQPTGPWPHPSRLCVFLCRWSIERRRGAA